MPRLSLPLAALCTPIFMQIRSERAPWGGKPRYKRFIISVSLARTCRSFRRAAASVLLVDPRAHARDWNRLIREKMRGHARDRRIFDRGDWRTRFCVLQTILGDATVGTPSKRPVGAANQLARSLDSTLDVWRERRWWIGVYRCDSDDATASVSNGQRKDLFVGFDSNHFLVQSGWLIDGC